ncbi:hypothetical protein FKP32DRAFT_1589397 [Trametes sanguinea]|nr:hypothetical protein FKP32DRAFT_1589397 [Trametes sanguinea]
MDPHSQHRGERMLTGCTAGSSGPTAGSTVCDGVLVSPPGTEHGVIDEGMELRGMGASMGGDVGDGCMAR